MTDQFIVTLSILQAPGLWVIGSVFGTQYIGLTSLLSFQDCNLFKFEFLAPQHIGYVTTVLQLQLFVTSGRRLLWCRLILEHNRCGPIDGSVNLFTTSTSLKISLKVSYEGLWCSPNTIFRAISRKKWTEWIILRNSSNYQTRAYVWLDFLWRTVDKQQHRQYCGNVAVHGRSHQWTDRLNESSWLTSLTGRGLLRSPLLSYLVPHPLNICHQNFTV